MYHDTEEKEEIHMKKMKRFISILASAILVLIPVLAAPVTSLAKDPGPESVVDYWYTIDYETGQDVSTGIPMVVTCTVSTPGFKLRSEGMFFDFDDRLATMTEEEKQERAELVKRMQGIYVADAYVWESGPDEEDGFNKGDSFTLMLPVSGEHLSIRVLSDEWELVGYTSNSITCICLEDETSTCEIEVFGRKYDDDMFWFKPMKTQLNIAAEIASTSGKEAVAEASGDFALSYEIMKWLENHPNVTLKYALTYKGIEYNIVIKGGQKLADPKIPWYGPEYLIGKFAK